MAEILCTNTEPIADIEMFVNDCKFPEDAFVLVERFPQHVIDGSERFNLLQFARVRDGITLAHSISGRVFSPQFELRWQEEDGQYRVVYLGEKRNLPELDRKSKVEPGKQKKYYLFGEILDEKKLADMGLKNDSDSFYYAEVRIPRLLRYPVYGQRVQILVREYVDKETGQVQFFRFEGLKREEESA